jgi:hypothetical protein
MGRTIGAAVGAVIVMLFFAAIATRARVSSATPNVSTTAQNPNVQKPAIDTPGLRRAH